MMRRYQLTDTEHASRRPQQAADHAWNYLGNTLYFRIQQGKSISGYIPEVSLEAAQGRARVGNEELKMLADIDTQLLGHDDALTFNLVKYYANNWIKDADRYWLAYEATKILTSPPAWSDVH